MGANTSSCRTLVTDLLSLLISTSLPTYGSYALAQSSEFQYIYRLYHAPWFPWIKLCMIQVTRLAKVGVKSFNNNRISGLVMIWTHKCCKTYWSQFFTNYIMSFNLLKFSSDFCPVLSLEKFRYLSLSPACIPLFYEIASSYAYYHFQRHCFWIKIIPVDFKTEFHSCSPCLDHCFHQNKIQFNNKMRAPCWRAAECHLIPCFQN